jgi:hypothetical protein
MILSYKGEQIFNLKKLQEIISLPNYLEPKQRKMAKHLE